ncbi:hypothetical protein SLS59_008701 [Nothophoma quercina]|uniref:Uncharacterized protein n=1 Tax=Nothophoma quercina TaxID=749835 RepID=A0ABR3QR65_9PLEO
MKSTIFITALGLAATVCATPISVNTEPRALDNGTVNISRNAPRAAHTMSFRHDNAKDTTYELVDESSHFSIGNRAPVIPIEYLNDPAAMTSTHYAGENRRSRHPTATLRMAKEGGVRLDAQGTGVSHCGQVNCPNTIGWCGKTNCPPAA